MIERTNVKEFAGMLAEGHYHLTVEGKPEKVEQGKTHYRDWNFITREDKSVNIRLFPWEMKELLVALGFKLDPDQHVQWDDDKVDGKEIECDIVHEEYPKKDGTKGKKMALRNIKEGIPF